LEQKKRWGALKKTPQLEDYYFLRRVAAHGRNTLILVSIRTGLIPVLETVSNERSMKNSFLKPMAVSFGLDPHRTVWLSETF